jgi:hypothetical protein
LSAFGNVTVTVNTIHGTSGNDVIRLLGNGPYLEVYKNGASYSVPSAGLGPVIVAGGSGSDTVNVDFSGGASPVPSAGLTVNGTGGIDTLIITHRRKRHR